MVKTIVITMISSIKTQARDAKLIVNAGYKITDVTPFDLFPQTRHIENVITFVNN